MKLVYNIEVVGFENVPHQKAFFNEWLKEGPEALFIKARKLIENPPKNQSLSSQPRHGMAPQEMTGWEHVGCFGWWRSGDEYQANVHCLEVFKGPKERYFLVDQAEHGDFSGHNFSTIVLEEIPMQ